MKRLGIFLSLVLFAVVGLHAGEGNSQQSFPTYAERDPWHHLGWRRMLNSAIKSGHTFEVKLLLEGENHGLVANINVKDPNGDTPMDLAVRYEKPDIIQLLIGYGAISPIRVLPPLEEDECWQALD